MMKTDSIFTIPAGGDPLRQLARALLTRDKRLAGMADTPLFKAVILLPTRRACRQLTRALLEEEQAMLLPLIAPLGDVEEGLDESFEWLDADLPTAIDPLERHIVLTKFIQQSGFLQNSAPATISDLALALAQFIDLTDRFEIDRAQLKTLVPDQFAEHWQRILTLLHIIIETWPAYLRDRKQSDPVARRNKVLRHFAEQLTGSFQKPLIIAGSTGSQPATAHLLKQAADYRRGTVILPNFDTGLSAAEWEAVAQTPTHPQYGLKKLLDAMEVATDQVRLWEAPAAGKNRQPFIRALLAPAARSETADSDPAVMADAIGGDLKNIRLVEANNRREEATIIALILRQSLEKKISPAALITPDRDLAKSVRLQLKRWAIEIDDEAGIELKTLPCFIFLKLVAEMMIADFSPLSFFSCLKHPLALAGRAAGVLRGQVRQIEWHLRRHWQNRDPTKTGLEAIGQGLTDPALTNRIKEIAALVEPLTSAKKSQTINFARFLKAHIACAEALAASDQESGAALLWEHDEGTKKICEHLRTLIEKADLLGDIHQHNYPELFESLFATAPAAHPHRQIGAALHIWSPMEARLQHADLIILGGLNEGSWPARINTDPWLNRAMRRQLGLDAPEAQIGLSAHDFTGGLAAKEVVLTRALKGSDGNPQGASPWLLQMKNILKGAHQELAQEDWQPVLAALHQSAYAPPLKTAPTPPMAARPKKLSASAFGQLVLNPYAFYAERILKLKPLPPLTENPKPVERGILIHDILHRFTKAHQGALPENAYDILIALGKKAFEKNPHPIVREFWWRHFEQMAKEFLLLEKNILRKNNPKIFSEIEGKIDWQIKGQNITLTARADRIDVEVNGLVNIYDYKTGNVPPISHVPEKAPQLPLEGIILEGGGFDGVTGKIGALAYIKLKERTAEKMLGDINPDTIPAAKKYLKKLLTEYLSPNYAFLPVANSTISDYDHLAGLTAETESDQENVEEKEA